MKQVHALQHLMSTLHKMKKKLQLFLTRAEGTHVILVLSIVYHFWITFTRQYLHFENETFILWWDSVNKLKLKIQLN